MTTRTKYWLLALGGAVVFFSFLVVFVFYLNKRDADKSLHLTIRHHFGKDKEVSCDYRKATFYRFIKASLWGGPLDYTVMVTVDDEDYLFFYYKKHNTWPSFPPAETNQEFEFE